MPKFYLIRHGETDWNNKKILMGQSDIPLNSLGLQQAEGLAEYFKNIKVDYIYSSDLSRALKTAETIAAKSGLPVIKDKMLRECSAGNLEGLSYTDMIERFPEELNLYKNDVMGYTPPGGESHSDFIARVATYFKELIARHQGQSLAIVTHGGVVRALLGYILSIDFKMASPHFSHSFRVDNCSVSLFKYGENWEITYLNDIHYLSPGFYSKIYPVNNIDKE
jgi:alpha-ribazole phosphatase